MFILCAQVVLWAQRMCPHASGVMLLGARGFFTHLYSTLCAVSDDLWSTMVSSSVIFVIVGSKNVPACVRGYAVRRPGIFYTFHLTLCAVSYDFGSTMV